MIERPHDIRWQLGRALAIFVAVIVLGAIGYYYLESDQARPWTLLESLYMAVITVSTVGYGEVRDPGTDGRIFSIILILIGVGTFTYLASTLANYLIAGELQGYWSRRRMEKKVQRLAGHFIVCAYGRMGSQVADEFRREKRPVVVVDPSEAALAQAAAAGFLVVQGDAKNDDVLRQAGVERAAGLVSCLDDDAGNLMVVLSARVMNEKLLIVARTNDHETSSKLAAAGANRVLWPYGLSGRRMAQMALRPNVVDFLEVVMHDEELELIMEELTLALGSPLEGRVLGSSEIRGKTGGAMIIAVRDRSGKMTVAPSAQTELHAGDIIVSLGTREQLAKLQQMAHGTA